MPPKLDCNLGNTEGENVQLSQPLESNAHLADSDELMYAVVQNDNTVWIITIKWHQVRQYNRSNGIR